MKGALVLVAGLSRSGKSTFADHFCDVVSKSTHVPLDKYFLEVPSGKTFLEHVQEPESIDWRLLGEHLDLLTGGASCYTPVLDWRSTGKRLSSGGSEPHPRARYMRGGAAYYVVPGCLSFEMPRTAMLRHGVYVNTPKEVVAARCRGAAVPSTMVDEVLLADLGHSYRRCAEYERWADTVVRGDVDDSRVLEAACRRICEALAAEDAGAE